ncbi:RNA binding protein pym [Colletotrichum higginsianum]|nr:RNA binding protein pym [Colletotrichum higginsianum]
MPSEPTKASNAGIITDDAGERQIPESKRADGSTRKAIKIRPGYRPPEDVEVYKNRTAAAFRDRTTKGGIPGAASLTEEKPEASSSSAASNKNAKRREARKKAKTAGEDEVTDAKQQPGADVPKAEEADPEIEKEKKARNLKKKLKQAKDLKNKKEGGETLLPEQIAKVIKINELIRELDALGFDAEGEPKAKGEAEGYAKTKDDSNEA